MNSTKQHIAVAIEEIRNDCFVIMPFDGLFASQYERIIKPAIEEAGLKCVRGDEIFARANIVDDIWRSIRESRAVVAELTGKNANVFYELGLAHAVGKPAVIITRNEDDVPFDLKALRYLYYDTNDPFWGESLRTSLTDLLKRAIAEGFSPALEGVRPSEDLKLPPAPETSYKPDSEAVAADVRGTWKGSWQHRTSTGIESTHHVVASLRQESFHVSGELTVSYHYKGALSVVLENVVGTVKVDSLLLQGISYSFVEKGQSPTYLLDNFSLTLTGASILQGEVKGSEAQTPFEITLKKVARDGAAD